MLKACKQHMPNIVPFFYQTNCFKENIRKITMHDVMITVLCFFSQSSSSSSSLNNKTICLLKKMFFCLVCSKFHFDPYILCTSMFLKFESLSFFFFFFFVFRGSSFVIWYKAFDSDKQDFFLVELMISYHCDC